jgi:transcriptional regulator with XRE-family HTH domain
MPQHSQRELVSAAGVSLSELSAVLLGKRSPSPSTLAKLCMAVPHLRRSEGDEAEQIKGVLDKVRRLRELEAMPDDLG